eukprot:343557-Pleurochrysis_carterae.AAC.1
MDFAPTPAAKRARYDQNVSNAPAEGEYFSSLVAGAVGVAVAASVAVSAVIASRASMPADTGCAAKHSSSSKARSAADSTHSARVHTDTNKYTRPARPLPAFITHRTDGVRSEWDFE